MSDNYHPGTRTLESLVHTKKRPGQKCPGLDEKKVFMMFACFRCANPSLLCALAGHSLQKLFHIPDLLVGGYFIFFKKNASILII